MLSDEILALLSQAFKHPFTGSQSKAAVLLAHFVCTPRPFAACILRGYAGTGKTTLLGALVSVMRQLRREVVLLAPTGRAAKVLALHAGMPAYTIHRVIYRQETFRGEGTHFQLGFNKLRNALFIVDEASMISRGTGRMAESTFGTGEVLDDLISYVYSGEGCRLLLVGDTAQLPPVGEEESPALDVEVLRRYGLLVGQADLTEVVRQTQESDVLALATQLRTALTEGSLNIPPIHPHQAGEVRAITGEELVETLEEDYSQFGTEGVIVVTRSNKQANAYNAGIRARIFDREEELTRGDLVMIVKNNYHWAAEAAKSLPQGERMPFDFIANGDVAQVVRLRNVHEQYGFTFADATLSFPDYADYELTCRVLLTTLQSDSPSLTAAESQQLYEGILEDYQHIPLKSDRLRTLRADPYYNALQLKYAYAVTCHKAQGGQWQRVYIDKGYLPPEADPAEQLRWFYTALTRTTDRVYLVNYHEAGRE